LIVETNRKIKNSGSQPNIPSPEMALKTSGKLKKQKSIIESPIWLRDQVEIAPFNINESEKKPK